MADEAPTTLPPGALIAGKYRVVAKLGDGGMGVVYEAVHQRLRQRVAIKMLLPSLTVHQELVERFEREARAAATIESPNVAKVIDVDFTLEGTPYMVLEFLQGHDLSAELEEKVQLSIAEAVGHVMTACVPIAQAHVMGIVHRDLKPSNLFLAQKGDEQILKVLDFGIAKVLSEGNAKITSSMFGLGTPHYMSPEQIRRSSNVDARSDIWSLGVILYELLTGTVPWPDEPSAAIAAIVADPILPPRELRPEIPEGLEDVIMKALEKDREKRYATARELAAALAPFAPEEELVTVPLTESMPRFSSPDLSPYAPRVSGPPTPIPPSGGLYARASGPPTPIPPRASSLPPVTSPGVRTGEPVASVPPPVGAGRSLPKWLVAVAVLVIGAATVVAWRSVASRASRTAANGASTAPSAARPAPSTSTQVVPIATLSPRPVVEPSAEPEETAVPPQGTASASKPTTVSAPHGSVRVPRAKPAHPQPPPAHSAAPTATVTNPLML
jgi:serine/threonine protein kinase